MQLHFPSVSLSRFSNSCPIAWGYVRSGAPIDQGEVLIYVSFETELSVARGKWRGKGGFFSLNLKLHNSLPPNRRTPDLSSNTERTQFLDRSMF